MKGKIYKSICSYIGVLLVGASFAYGEINESTILVNVGDYVEAVLGEGDQFIGWVVHREGENVDVCLCRSRTIRSFHESVLSPHSSDCENRDRPREMIVRGQVIEKDVEGIILEAYSVQLVEAWPHGRQLQLPHGVVIEGDMTHLQVGDFVSMSMPSPSVDQLYSALESGFIGVEIYQSAEELCHGFVGRNIAIFEQEGSGPQDSRE